jgi:hypothetical protein
MIKNSHIIRMKQKWSWPVSMRYFRLPEVIEENNKIPYDIKLIVIWHVTPCSLVKDVACMSDCKSPS